MDALQKTYQKYLAIYNNMSASQRATLLVVLLAVVGGFGFLMLNRSSARFVPASSGTNFSAEELQSAQQVLREKGLTEFKVVGSQLHVPRAEVDRYDAALVEAGNMPSGWAAGLEKQRDKNGWFTSAKQSEAGKQIALAKELRRVFSAIPGISDASVVWARSEPKRFSGKAPRVTATVNVLPKRGHDISPQLVHSLRAATANMVADLQPADVTIFNMGTGESHTAEKGSAYDGRLISLIKQHTQRYQEKIRQQLSYIPDVLVTVDVQLDNLEAHVEQTHKNDPKGNVAVSEQSKTESDDRQTQPNKAEPGSQSMTPRSLSSSQSQSEKRTIKKSDTTSTFSSSFTTSYKKFIAAMPKETHVSIAIPDSYFAKIAEKSGDDSGSSAAKTTPPTREQILADVKTAVANTIGSDANSPNINVRSYIRVDPEIPELTTPWTESLSAALSQWGGVVALGIFGIWALLMLKKNMPKIPEVQQPMLAAAAAMPTSSASLEMPEEPIEKVPAKPTQRDKLQSTARDNPEMVAAVLSQWLEGAVE